MRDTFDTAKTRNIEDAIKIQKGLIEFVADEATDFIIMHYKKLLK